MIDVGALDEIPSGQMRKIELEDRILCLINVANQIYIIDDRCSHADYSLSEGILDEESKEVECPKHGALFDIQTGKAMCLPATQPVATYKAQVVDGRIMLEIEN